MALFGKLFEKKSCDICGSETGRIFGNRKLADGNMCTKCADKLSPWFSERRQSTLAQIKEQLAYREANKAQVAAFHTTRTLGKKMKVLLDEDNQKFMVTDAKKLEEANPDVMDFADVTGCVMDVKDSKYEIYRKDKDGNSVSYSPKRYHYSYDLFLTMHVNNPYFDEIKFQLNDHTIEMESGGGLLGATKPDPTMDVNYIEAVHLGEDIRNALAKVHTQVRSAIAAANAPRQAVTCPYCGATTMPDANGCCEYCGGAVNG